MSVKRKRKIKRLIDSYLVQRTDETHNGRTAYSTFFHIKTSIKQNLKLNLNHHN